ncbi:MAG: flagellar export chaperone FliS [Chitinivibrionales bacterium]|nr:flagellar export chaperone FliS [Chitinivibrionales bacterium]
MKNGYQKYQAVNIDTADQGKLILIAYDVAIKHCKMSMEFFGDYNKLEQRTKHIFKIQDALSELLGALDMESGPIAQNLYKLYEYMLHRIVEANVKNECSYLREVLGHLTNLRDAWQDAIALVKRQAAEPSQSAPQQSFAITG